MLMSVCVHVQTEVLVMSPPSLSLDNKMSTVGLFQHIIITFYHASELKLSAADVCLQPRPQTDEYDHILTCLFCIKWKIAK